jgi:hypothetical protein
VNVDKALDKIKDAETPEAAAKAKDKLAKAARSQVSQSQYEDRRDREEREGKERIKATWQMVAQWLGSLDPKLLPYAKQPSQESFAKGYIWVTNAILHGIRIALKNEMVIKVREAEVTAARAIGPLSHSRDEITRKAKKGHGEKQTKLEAVYRERKAALKEATDRINTEFADRIKSIEGDLGSAANITKTVDDQIKQVEAEFEGAKKAFVQIHDEMLSLVPKDQIERIPEPPKVKMQKAPETEPEPETPPAA